MDEVNTAILAIVNGIRAILVGLCALEGLVGAFQIISGGEEGKEKGMKKIKYIAIGAVIFVTASALATWLKQTIGV